MKRIRIYIDTSVIGGCLDDEFIQESRALLQMADDGKVTLLLSDILAAELDPAPMDVQSVIAEVPPGCFERIFASDESRKLRDAYLKAKVVGPARSVDAHHIALATIARADLVVSWNFKHIVHFDKIRLFNIVNLREGYPAIDIRSPKEVV